MAAMYRLKGIGWLGSCAFAAIAFYLISSQVAAERKKLEQIDRQIVSAERDIRALETEFDVRANLAQLERWNGDTLALTVPVAAQFVSDEGALAALSPRPSAILPGQPEMRTAALIVPAAPAMPALTPASVPAAPAVAAPAVSTVAVAAAAPLPKAMKVAAVRMAMKANAQPRLTPVVATTDGARPRNIRAVAMLDKSLLSDTTIGDLLTGARSERSRLR